MKILLRIKEFLSSISLIYNCCGLQTSTHSNIVRMLLFYVSCQFMSITGLINQSNPRNPISIWDHPSWTRTRLKPVLVLSLSRFILLVVFQSIWKPMRLWWFGWSATLRCKQHHVNSFNNWLPSCYMYCTLNFENRGSGVVGRTTDFWYVCCASVSEKHTCILI